MRDDSCIFCKIAAGDIPSATLYEDDLFRVILDLGPANPGHALILPKDHFKDVTELDERFAARVLPLAARIGAAQMKAFGADGFNIVQNNGLAAGQTVFHFHVHVIPRFSTDAHMLSWTPGKYADGEMEAAAEKIRKEL